MNEETKKKRTEAADKIKELTIQAHKLIREAEAVADANRVEFYFSVEYGMGGTYYPNKDKADPAIEADDWESSSEGWVSSSNDC